MQTEPLHVGPRSTDLSEPILRALADGPKTSPILAQRMACTPSRLLYYLEPLAWKLRLVRVEKVPSGKRGGSVCAWVLCVPLEVALEAVRLGEPPKPAPTPRPTPTNTPSNISNNQPQALDQQPVEPAPPKAAEVLEAAPPKGIEPPKATPPKALTKAELAARLELLRQRHQALIAQGKIQRRARCSA